MKTTKNKFTTIETPAGITKREYFVAMAMQSIIQKTHAGTYELAKNNEDVCGDIAAAAISVADVTLKHLGT